MNDSCDDLDREENNPAVLLLGVEETPALPIIWSLVKKKIPISVGSFKHICAGMLSHYPLEKCIYPDPNKYPGLFVEWLLEKTSSGAYPVMLACGEQTTYLLSKFKKQFESYTSIPIVDIETFMYCRDKSLTMKAAAKCGVPIPMTWYPEDVGIEHVAGIASYPAVIKPCISNGARGISNVNSPDDLIKLYYQTKREYGACIVQEFIPHQGMQYKAEILLDKHQNIKLWGVYEKLRFYPPTGGSSTLNRSVYKEDILQSAAKILSYIKWWGIGDCDFIVDPRDGVAKLMEINPRFTRTIRVLVESGVDYPYELYRLALGLEPHEIKHYKTNVSLRYLAGDIFWFIRSKDRFQTKPNFFSFFNSNMHYEEWAIHDPFTGVGFWLSLIKDMLDPSERKRRLR